MGKWNLIVDVARCENCNNCVLAAKDELVGNEFPGYTAPHAAQGPGAIRIERTVRGQTPMVDVAYVPVMCNHCDNAPCIKAAGNDAIRKRADGIVVIDPIQAKGRRDLVDACPYGAIVWNEAESLPQHWFFDAHLLDAGSKTPRCVDVCPTGVFEAVNTSDAEMSARADRDGLRRLHPEWGTQGRVYYLHLERADRCFIGGSVSAQSSGRDECVADADVELRKSGHFVAKMKSDAFGDFKFDGLEIGAEPYHVIIQHAIHGSRRVEVSLTSRSVYLGEIRLQSA